MTARKTRTKVACLGLPFGDSPFDARRPGMAAPRRRSEPMKIGIVAGETSGDILGGRLMAAIRDREPDAVFVGVGGETMLAQGLDALAPLDALAVNGFKDPIMRSPSLFRLLRRLRRRFLSEPMDVVVGVDFNVFNLLLEGAVKKRGIPTAHYVSPSVYAWRPGRIKGIAKKNGRRAGAVSVRARPVPRPRRPGGVRRTPVGGRDRS